MKFRLVYRAALRDTIRNCIYGVDINPLAVELCKVALWLEAHIPGQPLNFLDHHIKCGNAIVGFARREELGQGVSTEAFKALPGDNKEVAASYRIKNKEDLQYRKQVPLDFTTELRWSLGISARGVAITFRFAGENFQRDRSQEGIFRRFCPEPTR